MKSNFVKNICGAVSKIGFELKKHSPEILAVAGTVGIVASTVMACKATRKIDDILDKHKEDIEQIQEMENNTDENVEYTHEDAQKDKIITTVKTVGKIAKLYAPSVILLILSLTSILTSNGILKKRNIALMAAYKALDKDFKDYRDRTVSRFGEEVDKQLRFNFKPDSIAEETVDEDGNTKTENKIVNVSDLSSGSEYVKYFTRQNKWWRNGKSYTKMFFDGQQRIANDMLRANGHITLNEVYTLLGFSHTTPGFVVGWRYDDINPTGDNYVKFDIQEVYSLNEDGEYELAYAIDFNVDGIIYDKV